jgi:hypothetical protein
MRAFLVSATIAGTLASAWTHTAQIKTPLFGVWRFNQATSKYTVPPPFARATCRIEPWEDGIKVTYDMVGTRGGIAHWEWTGKFDGRDYPLQGIDDVVTNAYNRIDDHTYSVVAKVDGHATTHTRIVISPDGKTMTVSNTVINAEGQSAGTTLVWDRL